MVLYGFTSPDTHDELIIAYTNEALFDGVLFPPQVGKCPKSSRNFIPEDPPICSQIMYNMLQQRNQRQGSPYSALESDAVVIKTTNNLVSEISKNLLRISIAKTLDFNLVYYSPSHVQLPLNKAVDDSSPKPPLDHATVAWMVLSSLPLYLPIPKIDKIVNQLSTCTVSKSSKDEFPISSLLGSIAKNFILELCSKERRGKVIGDFRENFLQWIAARNESCRRRGCRNKVIAKKDLKSISLKSFSKFLQKIVSNRDRIWTDNGGALDKLTITYGKRSNDYVFRMEEIFKYKMQMSYLLDDKWKQPLQRTSVSWNELTSFYHD